MFHKYDRGRLSICMLLLLFLLVACGSTDDTSNTNSSSANTTITVTTHQGTPSNLITPTVVNPKPIRGKSQGPAGSGPIVVTSPQPVPGGSTNSEQIVLKDRTLDINSISKQSGTNATSSLITLVLTVKNTSNKPIMNQPNFFQLIGLEGDIFSYQSNSSDNFYGMVPANGSRSGTIAFQIPAAAAHNLHLLYRPEVASETALVLLDV
jgi:uncharacterized protein YcfL